MGLIFDGTKKSLLLLVTDQLLSVSFYHPFIIQCCSIFYFGWERNETNIWSTYKGLITFSFFFHVSICIRLESFKFKKLSNPRNFLILLYTMKRVFWSISIQPFNSTNRIQRYVCMQEEDTLEGFIDNSEDPCNLFFWRAGWSVWAAAVLIMTL